MPDPEEILIRFRQSPLGVMMSSSQKRLEAEISPGIVNPGSEARAILWARETPNSIIPLHPTGMMLLRNNNRPCALLQRDHRLCQL